MSRPEPLICAQASTNDPNDSHVMFTAIAQGQCLTKKNASTKPFACEDVRGAETNRVVCKKESENNLEVGLAKTLGDKRLRKIMGAAFRKRRCGARNSVFGSCFIGARPSGG